MGKASGQRRSRVRRLHRAQRGICAHCGKPMRIRLPVYDRQRATTDEVWPRARGGMRMLGNQVAMHRACNEAKANRMPNGCEIIMLHLVNTRLMSEPGFKWNWQM